MLVMTYVIFMILTWIASKLSYSTMVDDRRSFREDARVLLWIAAVVVGGLPLLALCVFCHYLLIRFEMKRLKARQQFKNVLLLVIQAVVLYVSHKLFLLFFSMDAPLEIMLTTFGTIFLTQTVTVGITSFLFKLPLSKGDWRSELLKYNLMDSIYLSLYFITAAYSQITEPGGWRIVLAHIVLLGAIIGLFYWRTVGIRQTHKVKEQVKKLKDLNAQLTFANQQVLLAFASSLEKRDPYTAGHSERVAGYAVTIAKELGLSETDLELIHLGGLLHDIGKIGIPDYVLNKPDRLTEEEYTIMKAHPVLGEELLREVYAFSNVLTEEERQQMLEIVLYHHERPDGRGYPQGLKGDEIPLYARITAVADAYDAMTSSRAYRKAMSIDRAISILLEGSGTQFWTPAVEAFVRTLVSQHSGLAEIAATSEEKQTND
ncbi:MAG: HD-GYP domain-containing protein [Tumebacillaceae bacterium]